VQSTEQLWEKCSQQSTESSGSTARRESDPDVVSKLPSLKASEYKQLSQFLAEYFMSRTNSFRAGVSFPVILANGEL